MRLFEIDKSWLSTELTPENFTRAKAFVLQKWKERAIERGSKEPVDLSYSCKFGTLFMKKVFGGIVKGNYDHQYNVIDGKIIDLSHDSADVLKLADPYHHHKKFFGSKDHRDSMESCLPRVEQWVEEFTEAYKVP